MDDGHPLNRELACSPSVLNLEDVTRITDVAGKWHRSKM